MYVFYVGAYVWPSGILGERVGANEKQLILSCNILVYQSLRFCALNIHDFSVSLIS